MFNDVSTFARATTATFPLTRRLSRRFALDRAECDALDRFLGRSVRRIEDRVPLCEAGCAPGEMQVMVAGWACRTRTVGDGRRQTVAIHVPGDVCDFDVFSVQALDGDVHAVGPCRVATITRAGLNELTRTLPRVGQGLWWTSLVNAAIQREWMVNVAARGAAERLAHLACELFVRMALAGLNDGDTIDMPLTQAELGGACAMTPEHTNRTLRTLRTSGLMRIEQRRLTLLDREGLARLAGFDADYLHDPAAADIVPTARVAMPAAPAPSFAFG